MIWVAPGAVISGIKPHLVMAEAIAAVCAGSGLVRRSPTSTQPLTLTIPPIWAAWNVPYMPTHTFVYARP
jgi:hypothetical protein